MKGREGDSVLAGVTFSLSPEETGMKERGRKQGSAHIIEGRGLLVRVWGGQAKPSPLDTT